MKLVRIPFTEAGTVEDQYSLELGGHMTRQLFSIRIRQFNEAITAVRPLKIFRYLPLIIFQISLLITVSIFVKYELNINNNDSGEDNNNNNIGSLLPQIYGVVGAMIFGFIIYAILSRRYNKKIQKAINRQLDEFNRIDNPKQLNWRVVTESFTYNEWQFSGSLNSVYQMVLIIEIGGESDSPIIIVKSPEEAHINNSFEKQMKQTKDSSNDYFVIYDNAPPAYNEKN
ncbi:4423_t:CDS:2 [Ambispora gerdemannii]|uniref:4423_t:CDS:1 n=1 Tax=Ambispora gerdemannii TaxID=144530 RepID=A0A9N9DVM4_9GLOM|nr:4423_t:CDS:2 [Ambispora gerdemannii]